MGAAGGGLLMASGGMGPRGSYGVAKGGRLLRWQLLTRHLRVECAVSSQRAQLMGEVRVRVPVHPSLQLHTLGTVGGFISGNGAHPLARCSLRVVPYLFCALPTTSCTKPSTQLSGLRRPRCTPPRVRDAPSATWRGAKRAPEPAKSGARAEVER